MNSIDCSSRDELVLKIKKLKDVSGENEYHAALCEALASEIFNRTIVSYSIENGDCAFSKCYGSSPSAQYGQKSHIETFTGKICEQSFDSIFYHVYKKLEKIKVNNEK